jgi:S1-C subfamily serine protease
MVKRVVDSALGGAKQVVRPWLGVKGDTVTGVSGRGYAARAGFRQNDLIVSINGRAIASARDIEAAGAGRGPWEVVINRGGRQIRGVLR